VWRLVAVVALFAGMYCAYILYFAGRPSQSERAHVRETANNARELWNTLISAIAFKEKAPALDIGQAVAEARKQYGARFVYVSAQGPFAINPNIEAWQAVASGRKATGIAIIYVESMPYGNCRMHVGVDFEGNTVKVESQSEPAWVKDAIFVNGD